MEKPKSKKIYVTPFTLKSANSRIMSAKRSGEGFALRHSATGRFVSRAELKAAFKTASRKLKTTS
jgi:hypothetical protein